MAALPDYDVSETKMVGNTGLLGENYAAEQLEKAGYMIVRRNYHSRFGEVDIIASNEKYLVFAEVKTRATSAMTHPAESVTATKQSKLRKTALIYLRNTKSPLQPRFDVFSIFTFKGQVVKFEWIENAF